jgi:DNA repair protein RecN (Recombination protein N)
VLRVLRLSNFVIVQTLEVDFGRGFTVLTGETGAGKSILIDALGLLLGGRGDASFVREGASKAELTGIFQTTPAASAWLAEREIEVSDHEIVLRRILDSEGRSRAFVNDTPTTLQSLRELGESLIDVHGQHASLWLTKTGMQRQLLDDFAGHHELIEQVQAAWKLRQQMHEQVTRAKQAQQGDNERKERLEWIVGELKALRPVEGEWEELALDHKRLSNATNLIQGAQNAHEALSERDHSILQELEQLGSKIGVLSASDPALGPLQELLQQASIAVGEAADGFGKYLDKASVDPERLSQLDERIGALHTAARKFKTQAVELPTLLARETANLESLQAAQDLVGLEKKHQEADAAFIKIAQTISKGRKQVAKKIAKLVSDSLQGLGMVGAQLSVAIATGNPGPNGTDEVEFQIAGHSGATPRPLGKIASGGELSRVSLALAVVAASANPVPTLIFDEADAGVGGAVAEMIGHLMRELGSNRQVLCVTHLPQVAALAHEHWQVSKTTDAQGIRSAITRLDKKARVDEIARMLGGVEITSTTRKHAMELLR